ncbi:Uncharacterized protein FWK35_00029310 [Aphis craccivora]|uniref:Uncharacterized protein n=1 Tax=Aphis craccivora TaxID=307492 RepID=A0A6G0VN51_APHCR|nr:Uncharacterized protein FWK35_00029310 [Aphis craccivora]
MVQQHHCYPRLTVSKIYTFLPFQNICFYRCSQIASKLYHLRCDFETTILDSERSDKCIDFTMIITSRNNAPISNFGGGFRCESEYPWCTIKIEKNKKKK